MKFDISGASAWIFSPATDLLFVCGGALFLFAGLHLLASSHHFYGLLSYLSSTALLLVLLCGESHTVATLHLVFSESKIKGKHGRYSRLAACLSLSTFSLICFCPFLAPLAVRLYFLFVAWHFASQSRGIISIYFRLNRYRPGPSTSALWAILLNLTMINWAMVIMSDYFHTGDETFLRQSLTPLHVVSPVFVEIISLCIAIVLILSFFDLVRLSANNIAPPLPAVLTLLAVVIIFFPDGYPRLWQQSIWLFAPALLHGCQYLVVVARRLTTAIDSGYRPIFLTRTYVHILAIAIALFILLPTAINYPPVLSAVFVAAQLYHMLIDAVIWRAYRPDVG